MTEYCDWKANTAISLLTQNTPLPSYIDNICYVHYCEQILELIKPHLPLYNCPAPVIFMSANVYPAVAIYLLAFSTMFRGEMLSKISWSKTM